MAVITYQQLQGIRDAMDGLSNNMKSQIIEVIERVGVSDPDALRLAILQELGPILEAADMLAAEMAAAVFNGWRYEALGLTMETVVKPSYDHGKINAMASTAAKKAREGATTGQIVELVFGRGGYDMRRSYGQTMIENVYRDKSKPRFARVPGPSDHYANGCPFCRMLASRGFVYWNRKTAGEFDHYHTGCTCEVVSVWDDNPIVEGYDPDKYLEEYYEVRAAVEAGAYNRERQQYEVDPETGEKKRLEFARYKYGTKVGTRTEDYYGADYIQAKDMQQGYTTLGMTGRKQPEE